MFRRKPEPDVGQPTRSLIELAEQKKAIDAEIALRGEAELAALKQQLVVIAEATGHSLNELFGAPPSRSLKKERKKRESKPKYRDPVTGETWTGMGKPKKWLQAKLDEGRSLEEFALS